MKQMIILVGPPGSGKSTEAHYLAGNGFVRISQDDQGKSGHMAAFKTAIADGHNIVVDRMNFSKGQRYTYLSEGRKAGYETTIVVIHCPRSECYRRVMERQGHPTIQDSSAANSALNTFFSKYERPQPGEADHIDLSYPKGHKPSAVIFDLDGTLCNLDKRLHHIRTEEGVKKNWKAFFEELVNDEPNRWCADMASALYNEYSVVYASGRPDDYYFKTEQWLKKHNLDFHNGLYMRCRGDHREDFVAKEIILDFEILTRWTPVMFVDDRQQVVDLWRRRGFVALQCHEGNF